MVKRIFSVLLINSIFLVSVGFSFGKPKGDWKDIKTLVNQEIAIKVDGKKKKIFGLLKSADDNGIKMQIVLKRGLANSKTTFERSKIKKIWRALLFINKRNSAKGGMVGAGVGIGAGLIYVAALRRSEPLAGVAVPVLAIAGGLIGGVGGYFSKKRHKKRDLVYKR